MSKFCYFPTGESGETCNRCGFVLSRALALPIFMMCKKQNDCQHLGHVNHKNGVAIKVKCDCKGRMREEFQTVHQCDVHNRCLPSLQLAGEQLETWQARKPESDIYHLCHGCEQFEPTPILGDKNHVQ